MNAHLEDLSAERDRLVARAAEQRAQFVQGVESLHRPAEWVEQGTAAVAYLKAHPLLVASLTALVGAAWPWRAVKWASRGWLAWRLYRSISGPKESEQSTRRVSEIASGNS